MSKDDLNITTSGKLSENKKADEELEKLKKKAEEDKEKAREASDRIDAEFEAEKEKVREANEKAQKDYEDALAKIEKEKQEHEAAAAASEKEAEEKKKKIKDVAGAVVTAAAGSAAGDFKKGRKKSAIVKIIGVIVVALVALYLYKAIKTNPVDAFVSSLPPSLQEMLPDPTMGYNKIDFTNAVLGKAKEESELIVMVQEVLVDAEISNALANIGFLKKTQKIHYAGSGEFGVNLKGFGEDDVSVDLDAKKVVLTIPHTTLYSYKIDPNKTQIEDVKKSSFLALGQIKFTQEQQNILDKEVDATLRKELDTPALKEKADELAVLKVRELFQPVVTAVSEDFIVEVIQK